MARPFMGAMTTTDASTSSRPEYGGPMGNSKGRDNAKKRARRRKKTERLALAKRKQKTAVK
jgi:hypothetical protein